MSENKTFIHEIFTSLEGEGPAVGTPTIFVRVAGCDFMCPWCDTKQSWETEGRTGWTDEQLLDAIIKESKENPNARRLSITGGNPFLYKDMLLKVIPELAATHKTISQFNVEHPGVKLGATEDEVKEEREFLASLERAYLVAQLQNNSLFSPRNERGLSFSIDVKLAGKSFQEVGQFMENHALLVPHSITMPLENGHITFIYKYVVGDACDLFNLKESLWRIRKYTNHNTSYHPEEFIGIVRSADNTVDSYLLMRVVDAIKHWNILRNFRLNCNLHIYLNLR